MVKVPTLAFLTRRKSESPTELPVGPLELLAATYQQGDFVTLVFNQPINTIALNGAMISVDDPNTGFLYQALGEVDLLSPAILRLGLMEVGGSSMSFVYLIADPGNGIKPMGGNIEWEGIMERLPYP